MPHIRVTVSEPDSSGADSSGPGLSAGARSALARGLTGLAVSALRKSGARTTVHITSVPTGGYFVDGRPLTGDRDAHVEVSITAGTNSAAEKADFIARTDTLLTDLLGPLTRCGVALHELHPESYGYPGIPQFDLYRRAEGAPAAEAPAADPVP